MIKMAEVELLVLLTDTVKSTDRALLLSSKMQRISALHSLETQDGLQIFCALLLLQVFFKALKFERGFYALLHKAINNYYIKH